MISLKQRIIIPSGLGYVPGPFTTSSYANYPAVLENLVQVSADDKAQITLHHMFPKTLNSQISTSRSSDMSTNKGSSVEHSSGSTNTNVNTFGVGVSAGIFGELPVFNVSAEYSHSWENSQSRNLALGTTSGSAANIGASASMSIKDWSAYGSLDNQGIDPHWIWGQSFPWDVIQYNQSDGGSNIVLPDFIQERLKTGDGFVLPPSDLSLFGLDFTMAAAWFVDFPDGITSEEAISFNHVTRCYTATHQRSGDDVSASLQTQSDSSEHSYQAQFSLSDYALAPILNAGADNGAAIGFFANPFTYFPAKAADPFKIVSPAGNLQVEGSGFGEVMRTTFAGPVKLEATFKVADTQNDYALLLMHWIDEKTGPCSVNWTVNGNWSGQIQVSASEGVGGQNNVSSLELRNSDLTSINFHDYLVIGTNRVELVIEPVTPNGCKGYTLFALAIGRT